MEETLYIIWKTLENLWIDITLLYIWKPGNQFSSYSIHQQTCMEFYTSIRNMCSKRQWLDSNQLDTIAGSNSSTPMSVACDEEFPVMSPVNQGFGGKSWSWSLTSVWPKRCRKKNTHTHNIWNKHMSFCCSSPSKYAFTHVMLEEFLIFPSIFQNLKNKTPWKTIAHSSFLCWKSFLGSDPNCLCAWAAPRSHPQPSGRWTENRFVERRPGEAKPRSRGGAPGWHNSNSQGWWFYHVISMLNGAYKPA